MSDLWYLGLMVMILSVRQDHSSYHGNQVDCKMKDKPNMIIKLNYYFFRFSFGYNDNLISMFK